MLKPINLNKMKTLLFITFTLLTANIFAQEFNNKVIDEKSKNEILIGLCNKQGFLETPFTNWFKTEYDAYQPNIDIIKQLKPYADKYKITVIMGTWCSDSRREIPRFLKVMDYAGYSPNTIKILCVDTQKKAPETDLSIYNIEKVPTIIISDYNKELGRIIETPIKTLESDLLNILQNNN